MKGTPVFRARTHTQSTTVHVIESGLSSTITSTISLSTSTKTLLASAGETMLVQELHKATSLHAVCWDVDLLGSETRQEFWLVLKSPKVLTTFATFQEPLTSFFHEVNALLKLLLAVLSMRLRCFALESLLVHPARVAWGLCLQCLRPLRHDAKRGWAE